MLAPQPIRNASAAVPFHRFVFSASSSGARRLQACAAQAPQPLSGGKLARQLREDILQQCPSSTTCASEKLPRVRTAADLPLKAMQSDGRTDLRIVGTAGLGSQRGRDPARVPSQRVGQRADFQPLGHFLEVQPLGRSAALRCFLIMSSGLCRIVLMEAVRRCGAASSHSA
jgi:hypothetical protein